MLLTLVRSRRRARALIRRSLIVKLDGMASDGQADEAARIEGTRDDEVALDLGVLRDEMAEEATLMGTDGALVNSDGAAGAVGDVTDDGAADAVDRRIASFISSRNVMVAYSRFYFKPI